MENISGNDIYNFIINDEFFSRNKDENVTLVRSSFGSKKISQQIGTFADVLTSSLSHNKLNLFYENINRLNITHSYFLKDYLLHNQYIAGEYLPSSNTIKINKSKSDGTIFHELLHMSSSYCSNNDMIHSGFSIKSLTNNLYNIGIGLTEGYTEVLRDRYFHSDNERTFYEWQQTFSLLTECIVGKDKMENFYFNADLKGFLNELSKYNDPIDVINFLKAVDDVTYIKKYPDKNNAFKYIYRFLIHSFLSKEFINPSDLINPDLNHISSVFFSAFPSDIYFDNKIYQVNVKSIIDEEYQIIKSKLKSKKLN